MKAALKSLSPLVIGMICAGVCPGIGAGQSATPGGPTARSAKSLVQGKVVQEPGGQGIRKVRVILRGGSNQGREQFEATTDETGVFKIEGLEPGAYLVQLERSGYAADRKNRDKTTIRVVAGQDTKDLIFHMLVAGAITGKIVDADGDPLEHVDVVAIVGAGGAPRGYQTQSGRGVTNDLGEYRIADLPPGKYIVQAAPARNEAPPHSQNEKNTTNGRLVYVTTYFPGTLDQRQAAAVEVSAGGTAIASFGVRSSHAYLVSGTVMGLTAPPRPRDNTSEAFVAAMSQGVGQLLLLGKDGQREEQNLGEDGKFEFPNVLPGTYRAQLIVFSFNGQTPSIKMQTISTPIEVNGSDVVGLRLQLDRNGDVSGKFHFDGDEKIDWRELNVSLLMVPEGEEEGAGLEIMEQAGMAGGMAGVNEDGSFEIKDVPGANYQLAIGARSEKFRDCYMKSVLLAGREVADTGFAAGPGTVLDVLVSAKGAGIEGTVVDGEGKPVPNAAVVTVPSTGELGRPDAYQFAMSDESGHFAMRGMNPGSFLVLAFEEMRENYRLPAFAKKYEGKGQKVELEQGGRKSAVLKLITEEGERP